MLWDLAQPKTGWSVCAVSHMPLPFPALLPNIAQLVACKAIPACPLILDAGLPEEQYAVALVSVDIAVGYSYVLYSVYRNPGCIWITTPARLYGAVVKSAGGREP